MRRHLTMVLAALGLAAPWVACAGPEEYLTPLPPPWSVKLDLPPRGPDTAGGAEPAAGEASARALRDQALEAYARQDYATTLEALDKMAALAPLSPSLRILQAWCASFTGQDIKAALLWTRLADSYTNESHYAYMAGWHKVQLGRFPEAYAHFGRVRTLSPGREASHLAGISAWGAGRLAMAERLLVEAMRHPKPLPESFAAMAAIQAEQRASPLAVGWLRKALQPLTARQRAELLFRPSFDLLWRTQTADWTNLLAEFSLPTDQDALAKLALEGAPAPVVAPEAPSPPSDGLEVLSVSPYATDPALRVRQIEAIQQERRLRRLALDEQPAEATADPAEDADIPPAP